MHRQTRVNLRMVPMAIIMGTIFFLSHQPGDSLSLPEVPGIDKLAHLAAYGTLAASVLFAMGEQRMRANPWRTMLLTVAFCFLYGISDEFHQSFIPGRTVSIYDLLADASGAAIVCVLWAGWRKRRIRHDRL
jgi:VanZ family protein